MKYLIVGLGNPGEKYHHTRHNIGFLALDHLAEKYEGSFNTEKLAEKAEIKYKGRSLILIKPNTYMNLSGKAVNYWLQQLKIPKENLLVVVDDIALPYGQLRMRGKGSAGGHNGLSDIELQLKGNDYSRLRFGIGNDFPKGQQADYVLSEFKPEETEKLPEFLEKSCEMILAFCTIGLEMTMSQYNQ